MTSQPTGCLGARILTFMLGICLVACSGSGQATDNSSQSSPGSTDLAVATSTAVAVPTPNIHRFTNGTMQVGSEILPGTYRTRAVPEGDCTWTRLGGTDSGQNVMAEQSINGPTIVTIETTDKAFTSQGCGEWSDDLSPISSEDSGQDRDAADDPFSDGTYFVESEIDPGTWQASASSGCSWSRLSGFTGDPAQTIQSATDVGTPTVTVDAADAGFTSAHCGTWTKVE